MRSAAISAASIRQCLERNGSFSPLARQLDIFLTESGIDRQLGRPTTVLGMVLIKLLQCRQIPGVIALIMLLQCRYHFRLLANSCCTPHTLNGQPGHTDVGPGWLRLGACNTRSSLGVPNGFTVAASIFV